ncbi:hypothetical protein ACFCYN_23990 [Gottfriedia sp. NPDC056225]|uniref:hypothetical protein n=1 Tax=Gottfriedia sp. NPDC056225 TaxID=3345751 RepID=UPI0035DAB8CB
MASGLRNLLVRIGADASQMKSEMKSAQGALGGFRNNISGVIKGIGVAAAGVGAAIAGIAVAAAAISPAVQDAMKFEAIMGTLSETLGNSMNDFIKWQDTVGRSLGYSKLQSAELANTLSLNFKSIATSQADLLSKTTEMMKVAAIISSKRGMAMTEVSDRIRSAMNQEADGADELGVNVRASAIMQSDAYKQMANGTPWAQLSTNMQKTILYHHILQQVSQNLGIEVADNTAMRMNIFKASLLDARLALGQAFLPALAAVLPYLTAFANRVTRALKVVAAFMEALFGHKKNIKNATKTFQTQTATTNKQTASVGKLGDTFTKTGKKVKKAVDTMKQTLAGFDALNILSSATSSTGTGDTGVGDVGGGGGSGGGIDDGGLNGGDDGSNNPMDGWLDDMKAKVVAFANAVKEFLSPLKPAWDNLVFGVKDLWGAITDLMTSDGMKWITEKLLEVYITSLKTQWDLLANSLHIIADVFRIIADLLNGDWHKAWTDTKLLLIDCGQLVMDWVTDLFPGLQGVMTKFTSWWVGLFLNMMTSIENFVTDVINFDWSQIPTAIQKVLGVIATWWKTSVCDSFARSLTDIKTNTENGAKTIYYAITGVLDDIVSFFKDDVIGTFYTTMKDGVKNVKTGAGLIWGGVKDGFVNVYDWFRDNVVKKLITAFDNWKTPVKTSVGAVWGKVKEAFTNVYNWYRDNVVTKLKSAYDNNKSSISSSAGSVWSAVKGKFSDAYSFFSGVASKIKKAFGGITSGLGSSITSGFKIVYNKAVDFINDMIDAINKVGDSIDKVLPGNQIKHVSHIPRLAKGGITTGSTIANIGEAGREAVLPLENNTGWMKDLASQLSQHMGGGSGGDIIIQIGGSTLARITSNQINRLQRQTGKPVLKL